MTEGKKVQKMFGGIAGRYDLTNLLLSGGICRFWALCLARKVRKVRPESVADLATGSGDIAFLLRKKLSAGTRISAYDFCAPMLAIARARQERFLARMAKEGRGNLPLVRFEEGDCLNLPIADNSLDALTIAYGVRNFEDREKGLKEMLRVLKPGGHAFILEFSQPTKLFRPFYYFYLKFVLPIFAAVITGDKGAYEYLRDSIAAFPHRDRFSEELRKAGFENVEAEPYTFSIVAIHRAQKPL
ncbi:MAG: ubiquinone/menaquinone biosynthesis methyltransferase [Opitutales bacterium]|nr:ubiquinone/menaquinone biosynthesis methyltransferase [Opitutales bacterium]